MTKFNDEMTSHRNITNVSITELVHIGNLLHEVGLSKLAKRLDRVAEDLNTSIAKVNESYMNKLEADVRNADQSTRNIMESLVAGIHIGKQESV